jgi:hypothetical protein
MSNPQHVPAADLNAQLVIAVRIQDHAQAMFTAAQSALARARAHASEIRRRIDISVKAPTTVEVAPALPSAPTPAVPASMQFGNDELVADALAARILGRHPRTLKRWDHKPEVQFAPPIKINGRTYRRGRDFNEFLRRTGRLPNPDPE